jgi:hypothetical protein
MNKVDAATRAPEIYQQLQTAAAQIERLARHFHDVPGFAWYEGHLQRIVQDMRRHEQVDQFLLDRTEAGKLIDPSIAEIVCTYGQILDPYGVRRVPPEFDCVGRNCFVRNPGSEVWVWDGDLPEATQRALNERPMIEPEETKLPF